MLGIVHVHVLHSKIQCKSIGGKGTNPNEEIQAPDIRDLRSKAFVKYCLTLGFVSVTMIEFSRGYSLLGQS